MRIAGTDIPYDKRVYDTEYGRMHRTEKHQRDKRYRDTHHTPEFMEKQRAAGRRWYAAHKDEARASHRKRKYGLTSEEYDTMFKTQGGRCAICGEDQDNMPYKLDVDHDHNTGKVRGLLCHSCNLILGSARDRIDLLYQAATYLDRTGVL